MRWTFAAAAVALVACVAATWPAALSLPTHSFVPLGYADVQAGLWWPRQVGDALLAGKNPFFVEGFFWPEGQDVTLLVWNVLAELVIWPLWQVLPPNVALNVAALVAATLNGVASAAAARRLGADRPGELAAAALGGLSHFAFIEMVNGRIEQAFWAPVALYLAELVAPDRRPLRAGVWLGLAAAVYWFYGYFLLLVTLGWLAGVRSRAALVDVVKLGATSAGVAAPFFAPVALAALGGAPTRAGDDVMRAQAAASVSFPNGVFWPLGVDAAFSAMAWPLWLVPVAGWALLRGRGAVRALGAVALGAALLSLGPALVGPRGDAVGGTTWWLPHAAIDVLPGMKRFWWVYRWLTVALPAAMLAAVLLLRGRRAALVALVLVAGLETGALLRGGSLARPLPRQGVRPPPAVDTVAAAAEVAPVLVLPKGDVRAIHVGWQAWFRQPSDLGLGAHLPGVAPAGYLERNAQTALGRVIAGGEPPATWTPADTGGFRWVLLFYRDAGPGRRGHDAETTALDARLTQAFGPPMARNDVAAWWKLPG